MTTVSSHLRRWLRIALAWWFIVLGVAGLVLPFLQGILFLVIGLLLLAREQPWAARLLDRLRARYPRLATVEERAKNIGARWARHLGIGGK